MLQLDNETRFVAALAVLADADGVDTLFASIKATFTLLPRFAIADEQRPIALCDRYHGDPNATSLVEAGEHHIGKAGTDVVLTGHAYAPDGRPTRSTGVALQVAERRHVLAVYGDRQWRSGGRASDPERFLAMPLVYERALGGAAVGRDKDVLRTSALNPVGVGLDRTAGAKLPNLENPDALVLMAGAVPAPVGLGPIAPHWQPRIAAGGTYDAAWARRRAPLLPSDFEPRYFNAAPAPMSFDRFLSGGEVVTATGVSTKGVLEFEIPACPFRVAGCVAGGWRTMESKLETVALWPDDDVVTMTWRAALPCDREVLDAERVRISNTEGSEVAA
ncbi:MAG: DUF2169 domain-containing protein [Myxococcota bacterium]